ncbi:MAG: LTA synthase family protein [Actinomycetota bacterium]|nr:LTA synthase family protein [Actinomycetota bacterium]
MRPLAWHALLLASYPVLFLFSVNADQVPVGQVVAPLGLAMGAAALLTAIGTLLLRDHRRAALAVSALVLLVFSFGHVLRLLQDLASGVFWRPVLLVVWGLVAALVLFLAARARERLPRLTRLLNRAALILVATSLLVLGLERGAGLVASGTAAAAANQGPSAARAQQRDIFYLVFDRYGGQPALEEQYGIDNRPFLRWLEDQGFYVASQSHANYQKTNHSLASSLNFTYLDELSERVGSGSDDWLPVIRALQNPAAARFLQEQGYRFVHVGSWWGPTQTMPSADANLSYGSRSEFSSVLYHSTVLPTLIEALGGETELDDWELHYQAARHQFEQLEKLAAQQGGPPTFVVAHVLLPHPPYVFDAEGDFVGRQEGGSSFAEQLEYLNGQIKELVELLLAGPEAKDPIVILQADEGPFPDRYASDVEHFDWRAATDRELLVKTSILNAYYLPGPDKGLWPTISPVNSFRVVFNRYFGTDLAVLPDRTFVFIDEQHLYDFVDVTERLSRAAAAAG